MRELFQDQEEIAETEYRLTYSLTISNEHSVETIVQILDFDLLPG